MDENGDNKVTALEFFKPFYWADTRKDYAITADELNAYVHKYYVNICMKIRSRPKHQWTMKPRKAKKVKKQIKEAIWFFPNKTWSPSKPSKKVVGNKHGRF